MKSKSSAKKEYTPLPEMVKAVRNMFSLSKEQAKAIRESKPGKKPK